MSPLFYISSFCCVAVVIIPNDSDNTTPRPQVFELVWEGFTLSERDNLLNVALWSRRTILYDTSIWEFLKICRPFLDVTVWKQKTSPLRERFGYSGWKG